jgi:capsule biosynthesis phosphatase
MQEVQSSNAVTPGLNVVIPIGGIGSRFSKLGYRFPKPFINIVGRPMMFWLIDRLTLTSEDTLWIAISSQVVQDLQVKSQLQKEFPHLDIRVIDLQFDTRGAAETLFIVCQSMEEHEAQRRTISLDCDTLYFDDVLGLARKLPAKASGCVYFEDTSDLAVFSYLALDESGRITDIKEKKPISKHANTGAYIFASGELLRCYATHLLDSRLADGDAGEYYTSAIILQMIKKGLLFLGLEISNEGFSCVGTPIQLEAFLHKVRNTPGMMKPRRFCFDLDSTLVTVPVVAGDYSTCRPIKHNIELVRDLKIAGHHIIIQTARRMKTHAGNVGAVIRDIGQVTFNSLSEFGIPYDEIHFGKPWAHVYVDDLAVNALKDTRREIGWAETRTKGERSMVEARSINLVQLIGGNVVKSSKSSEILGNSN